MKTFRQHLHHILEAEATGQSNMAVNNTPTPAPGTTSAWNAPTSINTSRTLGAPVASADSMQNFSAGVKDAKEFYDLARSAGMPVSDAIPLAYKAGQATATGDIGGLVQAVTDKANNTMDKGIGQLKSTVKDYADLYNQFLPTSEYYKKNIATNPQLKAQADDFIKTNMTPEQFAQSIQQAEVALKSPRTAPSAASATVPGNPYSPVSESELDRILAIARYPR